MSRTTFIALMVVALIAATLGFRLSGYFFGETLDVAAGMPASEASDRVAPIVGERRPDYRLGNSDGEFVTADDFDGRVVLVNFWATWCKPCREEMPMLSGLHSELRDRGLQIVGIALDDVQQARDYAQSLSIEYPILVGSTDVMVTVHQYGNMAGTLPYSVLIDRQGIIRWAFLGPLEEASLQERITQLL